MARTGTKEWSDHSKNICFGCKHNCIYCYQKANMKRWKRIKTDEEWSQWKLNMGKLKEKPKKLDGRIMFPTTHDIFPEILEQTVDYLKRWLVVGNEILIVSKPHLECVKRLCSELEPYKDKITFRFTIGSEHQYTLDFWEKNAPQLTERMDSLKHAFNSGFQTSVSSEPFLDSCSEGIVDMVDPYITDTIWIGKMNRITERVPKEIWSDPENEFMIELKSTLEDDFVKHMYEILKDNQKVRWKDSYKKVLGLPEEDIG